MTQKVVEFCDGARIMPLARYFKEKITNLATTTIRKQKDNKEDLRQTSFFNSKVEDPIISPRRDAVYFSKLAEDSSKARDFDDYREKRSRQWNFEMNIHKEMQQQSKSIDKLMKQHSVQKKNDDLVKNSLQEQQDAMKEKLRLRRDRSFHKSMNREADRSSEQARDSPKLGQPIFKKQTDDGDPADTGDGELNILQMLDEIDLHRAFSFSGAPWTAENDPAPKPQH